MNDISLQLMTGVNIYVKECNVILHQPTILEISLLGEEQFFVGVQTICLNKSMFIEDGQDVDITNFDIFIKIMFDKGTRDKRDCARKVLELVMPEYKISFTPKSILINSDETSFIIDEGNFDILQDFLRKIFCSNDSPMDKQSFNPANSKAKEIADKIMRGRKRISEQNSSQTGSLFSQYLSILSVALQSDINKLSLLTMYQIYDLMERYSLFMNWDIDLRLRLAGGTPDKAAENWMKNIH